MKFPALILSLAASVIATDAATQVPATVWKQAESLSNSHRRASFSYSREDGGSWWVVSFFAQPFDAGPLHDANPPTRWIARRQSGRGSDISDDVRWADSATCPGFISRLEALSDLRIPAFRVPGISERSRGDALTAPTGGGVFTIRGFGTDVGRSGWVEYRPFGGDGHRWGVETEGALNACWSETPPTR